MRTIHDHVVAHLDPSGCGLLPGGEVLPDDQIDESDGGGLARWATDRYTGRGGDALPDLIAAAVRDPAGYEPLYAALCDRTALADLDGLLDGVRDLELPAAGTRALGRRLVVESGHRAAVKVGIALLGLGLSAIDTELLLTVGRHEEFTRFVVDTVRAAHADPEPVLLALARGVEGWGRISVVECFGPDAGPEVRDWLLRGGFRNSEMDTYLAHRAATIGRLADALAAEPDEELFDAAAEIVCALVEGGPAEDIDDYPDAPLALWLLVGHLTTRAHALRHFVVAARISEFLTGPGWDERYTRGWDLARHDALVRRCRDLMAEPRWRDLTLRDLDAADDRVHQDADYAARVLGIDRFPATVRRIRATPTDADWLSLMSQATTTRLPAILDLASAALPLAALSTGPTDIAAVGDRLSAHMVLGTVVTGLRDFPGHGTDFVLAALRCPVTRNRVMATRTLTGWGPETWDPEVQSALRQAVAEEPDPTVRESMSQLLTS
ncbi:hypothetical protein [Actinokineospora enzanensis]|uniref:hypothetical protein n=1 Tax=Actinokineospora enzanensis TaxID=155975 RepID=UPI0012EB184E|nr:hypothetical protein [Actinokineospora enzanensis]